MSTLNKIRSRYILALVPQWASGAKGHVIWLAENVWFSITSLEAVNTSGLCFSVGIQCTAIMGSGIKICTADPPQHRYCLCEVKRGLEGTPNRVTWPSRPAGISTASVGESHVLSQTRRKTHCLVYIRNSEFCPWHIFMCSVRLWV
jgi:hypothetical protein